MNDLELLEVLKTTDVTTLGKAFKHLNWNGLNEASVHNLQPKEREELEKLFARKPAKGKKK